MKKIYFTIYSAFLILNAAFGQGGTWTWISGDSIPSSSGAFGTQGVPSVNNHPPGLYEPCEWKDRQGNFWIYGGLPQYSDLWKFNPLTKEWTWVKGSGLTDQSPVFGKQGLANPSNTPGSRSYAVATWVDTSGALWLFGGAANNYINCKNDLWKYDIGSNQWTWMKGDSVIKAKSIHGTIRVADSLNTPGGKVETCSAWTDSMNNLWLFGGYGYDENGDLGYLNDLCKYDISANEWTWMKGSAFYSAPANYGIKGVAASSNDPGARFSYTKWKDAAGNFWLMGGYASNSLDDIWKYDLSLNEWIWMSGTMVSNDSGNYEANCVFNTLNLPYSRMEQRSAVTDNCGRFWLFGGANLNLGNYDYLSDLWVFDPQQMKWNWISGSNVPDQEGIYGKLGVQSPANMPPSRMGAVAWWGNDNKFYMFGGQQKVIFNITNYYADVWVFNPDSNCVGLCASVSEPPPVANFQANNTVLCANDCVNFTDLSTNATAWQWNFDGALDSTSTAQNPQNVCYLKEGIYNVKLIAFNSGGSDTLTFINYITVHPVPPTPVITPKGTTLYCSIDSSYTAYQWFDSTALIPGATDTFLVITHGGNYNVQVSNADSCKIAVGINIVLGVNQFTVGGLQFTVSPNPADDKLILSVNQSLFTRHSSLVTIHNVLGQVLNQSEIRNPQSEIDVSSLSQGIYFIAIISEEQRWVGKFVKE